jgi:hypothetical protein
MDKLQVLTCPFCGGNMAIRKGVSTPSNIAIGCDNPQCLNSVMLKIPVPDFSEKKAIEIWNTRYDNDTYPEPTERKESCAECKHKFISNHDFPCYICKRTRTDCYEEEVSNE